MKRVNPLAVAITGVTHPSHPSTTPDLALIALSFVLGGAVAGILGFRLGRRQPADASAPGPADDRYRVEVSRLQAENEQLREELHRRHDTPATESNGEDRRWLELAQGCADLFTELDGLAADMDGTEHELAAHTCERLQQVLEQSGVEVIATDTQFDRQRHKPAPPVTAAPGSAIVETVSPGFAVGRRVLRRAVVRVQVAR